MGDGFTGAHLTGSRTETKHTKGTLWYKLSLIAMPHRLCYPTTSPGNQRLESFSNIEQFRPCASWPPINGRLVNCLGASSHCLAAEVANPRVCSLICKGPKSIMLGWCWCCCARYVGAQDQYCNPRSISPSAGYVSSRAELGLRHGSVRRGRLDPNLLAKHL